MTTNKRVEPTEEQREAARNYMASPPPREDESVTDQLAQFIADREACLIEKHARALRRWRTAFQDLSSRITKLEGGKQ